MSILLLLVVAGFLLVGVVTAGLVTWLLLRSRPGPGAPTPHPGQPGYEVPAYGPPAYGPPAPQPGTADHPPVPPVTAVQRFAPPGPPPPPAAGTPAGAGTPAVPGAAQTWTAQVTEPGAELDDDELDETTRLREDLPPAPPESARRAAP